MKVTLRILFLLCSLGILIYSLLPPSTKKQTDEKEEALLLSDDIVESTPTAAPTRDVVRDMLGGAAIDAGERAKAKIDEINKGREKLINETENNF
jgi:hypothetical protein